MYERETKKDPKKYQKISEKIATKSIWVLQQGQADPFWGFDFYCFTLELLTLA
jgi:hypothetical protein